MTIIQSSSSPEPMDTLMKKLELADIVVLSNPDMIAPVVES